MRYEDARSWERVSRLKNKQESDKEHKLWWGSGDIYLNKEDIDHLINGGVLFFHDGEYSHALHYCKE